MSEQIQITLDKKLYDRLMELQVPPYNDINSVIERLLYHGGRRSPEAIALESEEKHFTMEEERRRASEGLYSGSGIST